MKKCRFRPVTVRCSLPTTTELRVAELFGRQHMPLEPAHSSFFQSRLFSLVTTSAAIYQTQSISETVSYRYRIARTASLLSSVHEVLAVRVYIHIYRDLATLVLNCQAITSC